MGVKHSDTSLKSITDELCLTRKLKMQATESLSPMSPQSSGKSSKSSLRIHPVLGNELSEKGQHIGTSLRIHPVLGNELSEKGQHIGTRLENMEDFKSASTSKVDWLTSKVSSLHYSDFIQLTYPRKPLQEKMLDLAWLDDENDVISGGKIIDHRKFKDSSPLELYPADELVKITSMREIVMDDADAIVVEDSVPFRESTGRFKELGFVRKRTASIATRIFGIISQHIDSENKIMKAFQVLRKLLDDHNKSNPGEKLENHHLELSFGKTRLLTTILQKHQSSPHIIIESCHTILSLLRESDTYKMEFNAQGLCEIITQLMDKYVPTRDVFQKLLETATSLSNNCEENQTKFGENQIIVKTIQYGIQTHIDSDIVMGLIIDLIAILSTNHSKNQQIFGIKGLEEVFVIMTQKFPNNISIRKSVCHAICALCAHHPQNQMLFTIQPISHILSIMMRKFISNQPLITLVCEAMWAVAEDNKPFQTMLVNTGITFKLLVTIEKYYQQDLVITERICSLLYAIGYQNTEVQNQFGQVGGGRILARIFESYQESNEDIISRCCDVVCAMVVGNHNNQSQIPATNIPEILFSILQKYEACETVVEKSCSLIWAVCASNAENQSRFVEVGVAGKILHLLQVHQEVEGVVRVLFGVIWALSGDGNKGNNQRDGWEISHEDMKSLLMILDGHRGSPAVVIQGLWALQKLATNNPKNQELIGNNHGCELLVDLINIHQSIEEVVTVGSAAIWALTFNNEASRDIFGNCGGCELVVILLWKVLTSTKAVENLCGVIWSMSMSHTENRNKFGALGCCELLAEVLRKHPSEKRVVDLAMGAIQSLCWEHNLNKHKSQSAGIKDIMIKIKKL